MRWPNPSRSAPAGKRRIVRAAPRCLKPIAAALVVTVVALLGIGLSVAPATGGAAATDYTLASPMGDAGAAISSAATTRNVDPRWRATSVSYRYDPAVNNAQPTSSWVAPVITEDANQPRRSTTLVGGLPPSPILVVAPEAGTGAENVVNGVRLRAQLTGEEIAGGHAFDKHVIELGEYPGITTRSQFASTIEDVVANGESRALSNGRTAFWNDGTVVIRNPGAADGGTAFRPTSGYDYFLGLN